MEEFIENLILYTEEHGRFTEESFEEWLDQKFGPVDWDGLEW